MSELGSSQLPPPPPPPAARSPSAGFDFARPFTFAFEDRNWLTKVLVGGLFYLATFLIVGIFFLLGYCAQLFRNVVDGVANPLPEWDDLGGFFAEGARLFGVVLVYAFPFLILLGIVIVPSIIAGAAGSEGVKEATGGIAGCLSCLFVPLELAYGFWIPAALTFAVVERRFGAAFEFGRILAYIKANIGPYALAFCAYLVASFGAQLGLVLFCIGVIFTAFLAMLIGTYGFAQVYRDARVR